MTSAEELAGKDIFVAFGTPASGKKEYVAVTYDPESDSRKTLAHLKLRDFGVFVSIGRGEVMITGGRIDGVVSDSVEIFDSKQKLVRELAPLNEARVDHGACKVGDTVIVCGGSFAKSCEIYSRLENRWKLLPEMKENRWGVAIVSLPNRKIIAMGGLSSSSVEYFQLPVDQFSTPTENVWRPFASMHEERFGHAAIHFDGKVFVAGGSSIPSVEIFSPPETQFDMGQWTMLEARMNEARQYLCLIASDNAIYAFGDGWCNYNTVEILQKEFNSPQKISCEDLVTAKWRCLRPIPSLSKVRSAFLISGSNISLSD